MKKRLKVNITTIRQQRLDSGQTRRFLCPVCGHTGDIVTRTEAVEINESTNPKLDDLLADELVKASAAISGCAKTRENL